MHVQSQCLLYYYRFMFQYVFCIVFCLCFVLYNLKSSYLMAFEIINLLTYLLSSIRLKVRSHWVHCVAMRCGDAWHRNATHPV